MKLQSTKDFENLVLNIDFGLALVIGFIALLPRYISDGFMERNFKVEEIESWFLFITVHHPWIVQAAQEIMIMVQLAGARNAQDVPPPPKLQIEVWMYHCLTILNIH